MTASVKTSPCRVAMMSMDCEFPNPGDDCPTECFSCGEVSCTRCSAMVEYFNYGTRMVCNDCIQYEGLSKTNSENEGGGRMSATSVSDKKKSPEEVERPQKHLWKNRWWHKRNCYQSTKHNSHTWASHILDKDCKNKHNAWCDGEGKPYYNPKNTYTTTYATKKKDYSEDAENFPVSNPITVTEARKIAYHMHRNQTDKSKEPYRLHLNAVEKGVVILGGSDEERIAALFHDAVEDYHTTYELLRKINLTEHTITMIEAVSKRSGEKQTEYLSRVIEAGAGAMRVKVADLLHNTRHDRLAVLPDYTRVRLLKKYRPAIARLMLELGVIATEEGQKELATKPVGTAPGTYTSTSNASKYCQTHKKSDWCHTKKSSSGTSTSGGKKGVSYDAESLLRGDWCWNHAAPILSREKIGNRVHLYLANGQKKELDANEKILTYTQNTWELYEDLKFRDDSNAVVTETQIAEYMDLLDEMKRSHGPQWTSSGDWKNDGKTSGDEFWEGVMD